MVKKTKFGHHPVQLIKGLFLGTSEEHITAVMLALQDAVLVAVASTNDRLPWYLYNIDTLCAAAGITKPNGAIGALVDVAVNDSGSAANATYMAFAEAGKILASKTFYVYPGNVNDRVNSRIIPLLFTSDGYFAYSVSASGAAFDYTIKIVSWLMAGEDYTPPEIPERDLACGFRVNQ